MKQLIHRIVVATSGVALLVLFAELYVLGRAS
jgi:hypothetical protein